MKWTTSVALIWLGMVPPVDSEEAAALLKCSETQTIPVEKNREGTGARQHAFEV